MLSYRVWCIILRVCINFNTSVNLQETDYVMYFSSNSNSHCNFLLNYTRKSLTILRTNHQQVVFAYSFKQRLDNLQQASQEYQTCCKAVTTTPIQICCTKTVTKLTTVTILLYHDFSPVTRAVTEIRILKILLISKEITRP